jgi:hypothetical protein
LKDVAPLASVGHMPRSQVLSSVTRAWEEGSVMLCTWVFLPDSWGTYTKILTKSAVDGDVLLSNEVTEGHVWVVTSE